jgi:hypothetical protein
MNKLTLVGVTGWVLLGVCLIVGYCGGQKLKQVRNQADTLLTTIKQYDEREQNRTIQIAALNNLISKLRAQRLSADAARERAERRDRQKGRRLDSLLVLSDDTTLVIAVSEALATKDSVIAACDAQLTACDSTVAAQDTTIALLTDSRNECSVIAANCQRLADSVIAITSRPLFALENNFWWNRVRDAALLYALLDIVLGLLKGR